jgi:hypothetical protein
MAQHAAPTIMLRLFAFISVLFVVYDGKVRLSATASKINVTRDERK